MQAGEQNAANLSTQLQTASELLARAVSAKEKATELLSAKEADMEQALLAAQTLRDQVTDTHFTRPSLQTLPEEYSE